MAHRPDRALRGGCAGRCDASARAGADWRRPARCCTCRSIWRPRPAATPLLWPSPSGWTRWRCSPARWTATRTRWPAWPRTPRCWPPARASPRVLQPAVQERLAAITPDWSRRSAYRLPGADYALQHARLGLPLLRLPRSGRSRRPPRCRLRAAHRRRTGRRGLPGRARSSPWPASARGGGDRRRRAGARRVRADRHGGALRAGWTASPPRLGAELFALQPPVLFGDVAVR